MSHWRDNNDIDVRDITGCRDAGIGYLEEDLLKNFAGFKLCV